LSEHFRVDLHPDAVVAGISANARVFLVEERGRLLPADPIARPTLDVAEVANSAPELLPGTAFLASFIQSYAARCWEADHIRQKR
jgi:hypothetical protein